MSRAFSIKTYLEYVQTHATRVALERAAISATAAVGPDYKLAWPNRLGRYRGQSRFGPLAIDFRCVRRLSRMASVDPFRRINAAIQRVNDRHRIVLGSEHAVSGGISTKGAGAAGIGLQTDRMETNRILLLVNFDAVS